MELSIPSQLEAKLKQNTGLYGSVLTTISTYTPWIRPERPQFFQEYTDHGIKHVEQVLRTATSLIRDEAWAVLTAGDAAVLVLATILHDAAMHLTVDSFTALLYENTLEHLPAFGPMDGFQDKPWLDLWEEFVREATRFDDRQLIDLFGNTEPVHELSLDSISLTRKDELLIGEFLRRHHPRLAHEIALWGVPSSSGRCLQLPPELDNEIKNIVGLVARSHGLDLRPCIQYWNAHYPKRHYQGIHGAFLMTLLRVGDYLQVDSERGLGKLLQIHTLLSPVSQREHEAHSSVKDIQASQDDPEAILIYAVPPNAKIYVRLKEWLSGIQAELDISWAVLGEVYGRFNELSSLGLVIRRVQSNIDEASFAEKVDYVPVHAKFRVAGSEVLKLLVEPLYGEVAAYGVRELIQNAVDAVQERAKSTLNKALGDTPSGEADVMVTLDEKSDGSAWLIISDQGIGMTPEVIQKYFLTAGASFRNSEAWRKEFEDSDGKSKVARSGRFGVGALAAFILGDEIEVSTRHLNSPANRAISFSSTLETEAITLSYCERGIGTTIRIRLNRNAYNQLNVRVRGDFEDLHASKWDWYCLREPSVTRIWKTSEKIKALKQEYYLPSANANLPIGWHRIKHPEYLDIQWTYENAPQLCCNGIEVKFIQASGLADISPEVFYNLPNFRSPSLSIFDTDGRLPLNLQRTAITKEVSFLGDLYADVMIDFVAFMIANMPVSSHSNKSKFRKWLPVSYPGYLTKWTYFPSQWVMTEDGVMCGEPYLWKQANISQMLVVSRDLGPYNILNYLLPGWATAFIENVDPMGGLAKWAYELIKALSTPNDTLRNEHFSFPMKLKGARVITIKREVTSANRNSRYIEEYADADFSLGGVRVHRLGVFKNPGVSSIENYLSEETYVEQYSIYKVGECPDEIPDILPFANDLQRKSKDEIIAVLLYFSETSQVESTPLGRAWQCLMQSPFIPLDVKERKDKLAPVYKELAPYIAAHRKLNTINKKR